MNAKQGGSPASHARQPALRRRRLIGFGIIGSLLLAVLLVLGGPRLINHFANSQHDPAATAVPTTGTLTEAYHLVQLHPSGVVPKARSGAMAAWTGQDLLLFGGYKANQQCCFGDLFAYNPRRNVWQRRTSGPPRARGSFVWDGSEALLYGGAGTATDTPIWRYLPSKNQWSSLRTTGKGPAPQDVGSAIWDGREMIVLANSSSHLVGTVWWYTPRTRHWSSVVAQGSTPASYLDSNAVWTGEQVLLTTMSGSTFAYNPRSRKWRLLSTSPSVQFHGNAAAWDGAKLVSVGGLDPASTVQADIWVETLGPAGVWRWAVAAVDSSSMSARSGAVSAWDGREVLIFGGAGENALLNDFWSLRPNTYTPQA